MKKRKSIFLIFALITGIISGLSNWGWAATDEVKTFGLVESGTFTETADFNDGSVVYVRVSAETMVGGSSNRVTVTEQASPSNSITITVYDDGTFPDDEYNDGYYWGKFTLKEGDGSGTDDTEDILEVEDGQTAKIEADIDNDTNSGTATITAA
ncbi:hypothetical protein J7K28_06075, partial [Candidatus Aerophobetes bacterium]|nr:hypothetical protein [Candidatus Aerophobetes bacterium]